MTHHQPDGSNAPVPSVTHVEPAVAEALRDISHRLRGPLGIFAALESDFANLSPTAQTLIWGAVEKIRLVVDQCTTTYSAVLPKKGRPAEGA
jgi:hypothetical protein